MERTSNKMGEILKFLICKTWEQCSCFCVIVGPALLVCTGIICQHFQCLSCVFSLRVITQQQKENKIFHAGIWYNTNYPFYNYLGKKHISSSSFVCFPGNYFPIRSRRILVKSINNSSIYRTVVNHHSAQAASYFSLLYCFAGFSGQNLNPVVCTVPKTMC